MARSAAAVRRSARAAAQRAPDRARAPRRRGVAGGAGGRAGAAALDRRRGRARRLRLPGLARARARQGCDRRRRDPLRVVLPRPRGGGVVGGLRRGLHRRLPGRRAGLHVRRPAALLRRHRLPGTRAESAGARRPRLHHRRPRHRRTVAVRRDARAVSRAACLPRRAALLLPGRDPAAAVPGGVGRCQLAQQRRAVGLVRRGGAVRTGPGDRAATDRLGPAVRRHGA